MQIRDPIHNFIELEGREVKLLETNALQRLRRIRQLALANLVYPGAVHTRFEHTLGVTHLAGQMARAIGLEKESVERIRLAALLHDVGHGPFSHVSETVLERYAKRDLLSPDQKKEKIHELVTSLIIENDEEISKVLGSNTCQEIVALLGQGYGEAVEKAVVSGPLDADKQDYLLRDSYFCGVKYGVFDQHQLHRSLEAREDGHNKFLMIKPKGVHAVEQYFLAKYYLTTNVYRHKVRLITDQMIVRALVLGIEKDNIPELIKLYTFDNTENFAINYMRWDDAGIFRLNCKGTLCHDVLERLQRRRLLKRVFTLKPKEFDEEVREDLSDVTEPSKKGLRAEIENQIADIISKKFESEVSPDLVIVNSVRVQGVKNMAKNDESRILVARQPNPVPFDEESSFFASINMGYENESVDVYAPVNWTGHPERNRLCAELEEPLKEKIEEICRKYSGGNNP